MDSRMEQTWEEEVLWGKVKLKLINDTYSIPLKTNYA